MSNQGSKGQLKTLGCLHQAYQDFHRRRLAGAVLTEKSENASTRHPQVEPVQGSIAVEGFSKCGQFDREVAHFVPPDGLPARGCARTFSTTRHVSSSVNPSASKRSTAPCMMACPFRINFERPATASVMKAPERCRSSITPSC